MAASIGRAEIINCLIVSEKSIVIALQAVEKVHSYTKIVIPAKAGIQNIIEKPGFPFSRE